MKRNIAWAIVFFITGCVAPRAPIDPVAHADMGLKYLQEGDVRRAEKHLQYAMQQDPTSVDVLTAMAYYDEVIHDVSQAEILYQRALALHPGSANAHNNWGTFLCRHGRYREAIIQFEWAIQSPLYLNKASAYENAGLCAALIPDCLRAKTYFQQALVRDPALSVAKQTLATLSCVSQKI